MKKVFFGLVALLLSGSAMAQVKFADLTLDEAIAKAKVENKRVMVMGSATWCSPCKYIETNLFPSEELGEYLNTDYIILMYKLDKHDPYDVKQRFAIKSYPTFLFLDGEGKEVCRMLGGADDVAGFIEKVETTTKGNSSWAYHEEQLKKDKDYTMTYVKALEDAYLMDKAQRMFNDYFDSRTIKENFDKAGVEYYKGLIKTIDHKVFTFMIENNKEVAKAMGKDNFDIFVTRVVNEFTMKNVRRAKSVDAFEAVLAPINGNKILKNDYSKFLFDNSEIFVNRSAVDIIAATKKVYKKVDARDLPYIVYSASIYTRVGGGYIPEIESDLLEIINYTIDKGDFVSTTKKYLTFIQRQLTEKK